MEAYLDIRILSFVTSLVSFILFLCMTYVYKQRKTYAGFGFWTYASLLNFMGMLLLCLRNHITDFASIIIANSLITISFCFICCGVERFFSLKPSYKSAIILILLQLLSFLSFTYLNKDINARIIIICIAIALPCLRASYLVQKHSHKLLRQNNKLLSLTTLALGLWYLIRMFFTIINAAKAENFMDFPAIHGLSMAIYFSSMIFLYLGLLILNSVRIENDLQKSLDEIKTLQGIIPVCASCKSIMDDEGSWKQMEQYICEHSAAEFSHSVCPECCKKLYPDLKLYPNKGQHNTQ